MNIDERMTSACRPAATQVGRTASPVWAGLAALWAFAFAAMSFYWAAGGMLGVETLGREMAAMAQRRDADIIAAAWVTGMLKVVGGLFALGLLRRWQPRVQSLLKLAVLAGGALLTLYAIALIIQHGLMAAGVISLPASLGTDALPRHLLLWDPWWLLGGVLFLIAGWSAYRHAP